MQSFVLPLLAAKQMCHALLPHVDRHPFPFNLGGIRVVAGYAYATDRYTVGRFDHTNLSTRLDENTGTWIPRAALEWVQGLGPATLIADASSYVVSFGTFKNEHDSGWYCMVRVEFLRVIKDSDPEHVVHAMRLFAARGADECDKFPPVGRLFDDFLPGVTASPTIYRSDLMSRFTSFANRHLIHRAGHHMRLTLPLIPESDRSKLKPTLVEIGPRFKGLMMPTTLAVAGDKEGFGYDLATENQIKKDTATIAAERGVSATDTEES